MEIHQFVVVTKENPANHTREEILVDGVGTGETEITENTKVLCFIQERGVFDEEGNEVSPTVNKHMPLEDMPADIQTAAMNLFNLVVPFAETL